MTMHFVFVNGRTQAAIRSLEFLLLLLGQRRIFEFSKDVVKFGFKVSQLCAKHDQPPFMRHSER